MADTRTRLSDKATISTGISKLIVTEADGDVRQGDLAALKAFVSISGDFIGTTDTQTLTNKTLTAPTINDGLTIVATDTDFTLTYGTSTKLQRHTGTLTAGRTITLAGGVTGASFRITRVGSGAFNLSVGGLKNLIQNTWCVVVYDGTNWVLSEYGAL